MCQAWVGTYLERCTEGPAIITKNGRPVAALLAGSDEEDLERLVLAHTPRFVAPLDSAYTRVKKRWRMRHVTFGGLLSIAGLDPARPSIAAPQTV